jgi:hypothetical protein
MHDHISNVDIDGIYEMQIPLSYKVILELGSLIKPRTSKIDRSESSLNRTYQTNEFTVGSFDERTTPFKKEINKILFYYSSMNK